MAVDDIEDFLLFFGINPNRSQSLTYSAIGANKSLPIGS